MCNIIVFVDILTFYLHFAQSFFMFLKAVYVSIVQWFTYSFFHMYWHYALGFYRMYM